MKITIRINCENAAFGDDPGIEIARILRERAAYFRAGKAQYSTELLDSNGNACGVIKITGKR